MLRNETTLHFFTNLYRKSKLRARNKHEFTREKIGRRVIQVNRNPCTDATTWTAPKILIGPVDSEPVESPEALSCYSKSYMNHAVFKKVVKHYSEETLWTFRRQKIWMIFPSAHPTRSYLRTFPVACLPSQTAKVFIYLWNILAGGRIN